MQSGGDMQTQNSKKQDCLGVTVYLSLKITINLEVPGQNSTWDGGTSPPVPVIPEVQFHDSYVFP